MDINIYKSFGEHLITILANTSWDPTQKMSLFCHLPLYQSCYMIQAMQEELIRQQKGVNPLLELGKPDAIPRNLNCKAKIS